MCQSLTKDTENQQKSSKSMKKLRQRCVKVKLDILQVNRLMGFRNWDYWVEISWKFKFGLSLYHILKMLSAFLTGLFLGLSLIVAIGAQNAFVIRSGILRNHIFYIALFCAISDSLLIILGIAGISFFLKDFINEFSNIIFGFSALWLLSYGLLRIRSALIYNSITINNKAKSSSLLKAI